MNFSEKKKFSHQSKEKIFFETYKYFKSTLGYEIENDESNLKDLIKEMDEDEKEDFRIKFEQSNNSYNLGIIEMNSLERAKQYLNFEKSKIIRNLPNLFFYSVNYYLK